jgi:hypothetical protein
MNGPNQPAEYPVLLRVTGWLLAGLMWCYPIDAFRTWWTLRQYEPVSPRVSAGVHAGYLIDLQLGVTHAGLIGWMGALACVLGLVWLVAAGSIWARYRARSRRLNRASLAALLAVAGSVSAFFLSHYLLWRVFGILVS